MNRSSMPRRRTALHRGKPLRRTAWRRSGRKPAVPDDRRAELAKRSEGLCEIGIRYPNICTGVATDPSHRAGIGSGGSFGAARQRADRLSNVLHACRPCHDWCHDNPLRAQMNGWMLERWQDPTAEPVWRRGELVWLTDDGRALDYEAGAA